MSNTDDSAKLLSLPQTGRLIALDPGTKRVGVAVCDPSQTIASPIRTLTRRSWKILLADVAGIIEEFDATALIIGLPLEFDGSSSEWTAEAIDMARKFELSLTIPAFLQDERATSYEARGKFWSERPRQHPFTKIDAEAAAIILADFLDRLRQVRLHGA